MSDTAPELLVVVGPTASGKTALCLDLAQRLNAEIVSADSVQVYRHFDIGSGKPSAEQRASAPHHLIDILEPPEPMDAVRWAELAELAISEIQSRGKTPIVCGGSFLWIRALIWGLVPAAGADLRLRERHRELAAAAGPSALHAELAAVDPESSRRLNERDLVRVSRALEVYELTGVPISRWQAEHGFRTPRFPARLLGLRRSREELDARILARTENLLREGLVEEVRSLLGCGYGTTRAMSSVGYRQVAEALASGEHPDQAVLCQAIYRKTRVFARRQKTWLRDQAVEWLDPETAVAQVLDRRV